MPAAVRKNIFPVFLPLQQKACPQMNRQENQPLRVIIPLRDGLNLIRVK